MPRGILSCSDCLGMGFNDSGLACGCQLRPELIGESFAVSSVNDGCVLEFDFVASGTAFTLEFVFGSDEYETLVNTQFNDVFAFFLSGPWRRRSLCQSRRLSEWCLEHCSAYPAQTH
jgi:hypothetical protein